MPPAALLTSFKNFELLRKVSYLEQLKVIYLTFALFKPQKTRKNISHGTSR
jgi:hypothetical protein